MPGKLTGNPEITARPTFEELAGFQRPAAVYLSTCAAPILTSSGFWRRVSPMANQTPTTKQALPAALQRKIVSEHYEYKNGTRKDPNTGREVDLFQEPNGSIILAVFEDDACIESFELSPAESALIADYA